MPAEGQPRSGRTAESEAMDAAENVAEEATEAEANEPASEGDEGGGSQEGTAVAEIELERQREEIEEQQLNRVNGNLDVHRQQASAGGHPISQGSGHGGTSHGHHTEGFVEGSAKNLLGVLGLLGDWLWKGLTRWGEMAGKGGGGNAKKKDDHGGGGHH
ncbi:MAG: hypothetical protein V4644_02180 [Patescibacteria group bacterium]